MKRRDYRSGRNVLICGLVIAVIFLNADFLKKWGNSKEVLVSTNAYEAIPFSEFEIERILVYTETDSLNWYTKNEKDINCIYEIFLGIEFSYTEKVYGDAFAASPDNLYVIFYCTNGNEWSFILNSQGGVLISESSVVDGLMLQSPPAGVYSLTSIVPYDRLWEEYRENRTYADMDI